jgi:uncharacterized membrane protein
MDLDFQAVMHRFVQIFEVIGVAILVVGSVLAFIGYLRQLVRGTQRVTAFVSLRAGLGRAILLGLEVLVVADIVRTIVVEPTLDSALSLGLIVLVRIALSFAIDIEIEGVAPWRRTRAATGGGTGLPS